MEKEFVKEITNREDDFAQWYTDIVLKSGLARYSCVRGCMYVQPYGTALWENIRNDIDARLKATGHKNVMLPMFIPESLLNKEKDHIEGFAPEVAWVTHGGKEELAERLCVRPTSETLFCDYYSGILRSYRDLPILYNQWANVCRWEKTTRLFLRTAEFYWQEGHTLHETAEEAVAETERIHDLYTDFVENDLAIPVIRGKKTDKEKFAGAESTYTIEAMMYDGKALQGATSHYFGNQFAKAFGLSFMGRDGKEQVPYQTSWGISTRIIGGIIMVHGDNRGLKLPPKIAPIQVEIVPIAQQKEGVLNVCGKLKERLEQSGIRVEMDDSNNTPGWKFAECEMKGIPLRVECGPRDIENGVCILVRRDTGEKISINMDNLESEVKSLLEDIQKNMYKMAYDRRAEMIYTAKNMDEMIDIANNKQGFIKAMWCGDLQCEMQIKDKAGLTSRCIPWKQEKVADTCVCCGKKADKMVYFGKSY